MARALPIGATLAFQDDACVIAQFDHLVISLWRTAPTLERMRAFRSAQQRVLAGPDPVGGMIVIQGLREVSLPDDAVRAEARMIYDAVRQRRDATAIAIEAEGFAAATARAFMSGIALLSGTQNPQRIFDGRSGAATFMSAFLARNGHTLASERIVEVVDALERSLGGPA